MFLTFLHDFSSWFIILTLCFLPTVLANTLVSDWLLYTLYSNELETWSNIKILFGLSVLQSGKLIQLGDSQWVLSCTLHLCSPRFPPTRTRRPQNWGTRQEWSQRLQHPQEMEGCKVLTVNYIFPILLRLRGWKWRQELELQASAVQCSSPWLDSTPDLEWFWITPARMSWQRAVHLPVAEMLCFWSASNVTSLSTSKLQNKTGFFKCSIKLWSCSDQGIRVRNVFAGSTLPVALQASCPLFAAEDNVGKSDRDGVLSPKHLPSSLSN